MISWQLRPKGHGTRILFSHNGFDPGNPLMQRARTIMSPGWASMLENLEPVVAEAD